METNSETVVFDDWTVRDLIHYKTRCKEYRCIFLIVNASFIVIIPGAFLAFFYSADVFFAVLPFSLIMFITTIVLYLEWSRLKNNHLIIKPMSIEITNLFNKVSVYEVNYKDCTLEIDKNYSRGRGILLTFIDRDGKKICTYEDTINTASYLGDPLTDWEKALISLGIPLVDKSYIFKNNLYGR